VDSELNFEWPDPPYFLSPEVIDTIDSPLPYSSAGEPYAEPHEEDPGLKPPDLWAELGEAQETIARLEGDRRVARDRIEELEQSCAAMEERVAAQRRRLLVLERQLEDVGMEPAEREPAARSSWLDRIFGGLSSARAPEPDREVRR